MSALQYLPGLGKSDHVLMQFQLACYTQLSSPTHSKRYNLHKADFARMCAMLDNRNWQGLGSLDVDTGYDIFNPRTGRPFLITRTGRGGVDATPPLAFPNEGS